MGLCSYTTLGSRRTSWWLSAKLDGVQGSQVYWVPTSLSKEFVSVWRKEPELRESREKLSPAQPNGRGEVTRQHVVSQGCWHVSLKRHLLSTPPPSPLSVQEMWAEQEEGKVKVACGRLGFLGAGHVKNWVFHSRGNNASYSKNFFPFFFFF